MHSPIRLKHSNLLFMAPYAFLVALIFALRPIGDPDTWWHLKVGSWIIENLKAPVSEIYSYTAYGQPWIHHEWLASALFWLVFSCSGTNGLILFSVIIFAAYLYFAGRAVQVLTQNQNIPTVIIFLLAFISSFRVTPRPHIIANLFFSILFFLLYKCFYRSNSRRWTLLFFPLLFILWANMHTSVFMGLMIMILYWGGGALWSLRQGDKEWIHKPLLILIFICILAIFVNPYTTEIWLVPLQLNVNTIVTNTTEFFSPLDKTLRGYVVIQGYFVVFVVTTGLLVCRLISIPFQFLFIYLFLGYFSLKHHRFIDIYSLWALPFISSQIRTILPFKKSVSFLDAVYGRIILAAFVLLPLLFFIIKGVPARITGGGTSKMAVGVYPGTSPMEAVDFLDQHRVKEKIFASFETGSYLIATGRPVFIDGRTSIYGEEFFRQFMRMFIDVKIFESEWKKWDFGVALLPHSLDRSLVNLHAYFLKSYDWDLVYFDGYYYIYLDHRPANLEVIEQFRWPKDHLKNLIERNKGFM